jgi:hypothetical protein
MTLKDLLNSAIDKKITYGEALAELKKLKLPPDDEETYDIMLHKLLGNDEKILHDSMITMRGIPNDMYYQLLAETIQMVRGGLYSPDICQELFDHYQLVPAIINYFINEAICIVRMNTLKPEEIAAIGQAYHKVAVALTSGEPQIEGVEQINAEQVSEVVEFNGEDDFYDD